MRHHLVDTCNWRTGRSWARGDTVADSPVRRLAPGWGTTGARSTCDRRAPTRPTDSRGVPCRVRRSDRATCDRKAHVPSERLRRRRTTREISRRGSIRRRSTALCHHINSVKFSLIWAFVAPIYYSLNPSHAYAVQAAVLQSWTWVHFCFPSTYGSNPIQSIKYLI